MSRTFDVVLFGATGFTGRLVAEYLAAHAPPTARIALAGRSQSKLEQIRSTLPAAAQQWPLLVGDATDAAAMSKIAEDAVVVCTTVGPYAKYGLPLVQSCAKAGTHYCDLTGETQFMRDSIDSADAAAKASGARIVHTCGFDSIPSDLGVWLLHRNLGQLARATYVLVASKGGFSGGTVASLLNALDEARTDRSRRRIMGDPYALSPERAAEPNLGDERELMRSQYDDFVGQWVAPWVMASINTRVVRRSNALFNHAYGRRFRYSEVMGMKTGFTGMLKAAGVAATMGLFMSSLMWKPTRRWVESRLPKPGEGPDAHMRSTGFLKLRIFAESETGAKKSLEVTGQGDPGYQLTALMLGESALCLAFDAAKTPPTSGVLTPATAMGQVLVDRLRAAGMTFNLEQ
jgi:short subunit dehydrogenase-like uncharacterized protein